MLDSTAKTEELLMWTEPLIVFPGSSEGAVGVTDGALE